MKPPADYHDWLGDIKTQIHEAQQLASQALNLELVALYWRIGKAILDRQNQQGWGAKVIDRLAHDLRTNFPEMKGFSSRNLKYMRAFAEAWPESYTARLLRWLCGVPGKILPSPPTAQGDGRSRIGKMRAGCPRSLGTQIPAKIASPMPLVTTFFSPAWLVAMSPVR